MSEKKFEVGQEIFVVRSNAYGLRHTLDRIKSISKTRGDIKLENESHTTYSSAGRSKEKGMWSYGSWLEVATVELREKVTQKNAREYKLRFVKDFRLADLDNEDLRAVYSLMKSPKYEK